MTQVAVCFVTMCTFSPEHGESDVGAGSKPAHAMFQITQISKKESADSAEEDLKTLREYIDNNPTGWQLDEKYLESEIAKGRVWNPPLRCLRRKPWAGMADNPNMTHSAVCFVTMCTFSPEHGESSVGAGSKPAHAKFQITQISKKESADSAEEDLKSLREYINTFGEHSVNLIET